MLENKLGITDPAELGGALMVHESRYVNANLHRYTPQAALEAELQGSGQ